MEPLQAQQQGEDARRSSWGRFLTHWWTDEVIDTVDHRAVIEKRREECRLTARYLFMTAMSAAIAVLGLLLSSPAVVIGAMLLSPLMDPIIGAGFALAIGDYRWLLKAARTLFWGSVLAIALCALIVVLSPLQTITSEIAARTRPNLFDLMVALFSAMAGAYATIRGREGTIVGVAIATALMPPLAVIGFGLATFNWTVFSGSLLLYITNLMAIAITAALMARLYGFRTRLSEEQSRLQNIAMVVAFVALAVPLALSLRQIAWEANSTVLIRKTIEGGFDKRARLSDLEVNWDTRPIHIEASVLTADPRDDAEALFTRLIAGQLGAPVDLDLTQIEIGTNRRAAEQAQIAAARASEEQAQKARIEALATRLGALAGGDRNRVVVESERSRALVQAMPIEGIDLAGWRALERRLAMAEPGWSIEIVPPAEPLPEIAITSDGPSEAGKKAIDTIAWAAARRGQPVELVGPRAQAQAVAALLQERQVTVRTVESRGALRARWAQD